MGTGCPESFVGLNPAIQIPMSSAPPIDAKFAAVLLRLSLIF